MIINSNERGLHLKGTNLSDLTPVEQTPLSHTNINERNTDKEIGLCGELHCRFI